MRLIENRKVQFEVRKRRNDGRLMTYRLAALT